MNDKNLYPHYLTAQYHLFHSIVIDFVAFLKGIREAR